ncbi:MAG: septal ring lytic transglycosylase RlpA family protein [Flavobacteriales bacterium]|nr:septal ring lytic transglycosylase RlpA family protein [Flavobacteriales bacterium]
MKQIIPFLIALLLSSAASNLQKGTASFYGKSLNGRRTSSGEILHNDSLYAAHKTLPFGTIVRVVNLKNDSVVLVKIIDRMSKKSSRIIDLTQAAAKQLNFIQAGLTTVTLEVIE